MDLNPYALPPLLTAAAILLFGLAILSRGGARRPVLLFFAVTVFVAIWLTSFSFMYASPDVATALLWARRAYLGVPFIPAAIYHFAAVETGTARRRRVVIPLAWVLAGVFSAVALGTDAWVGGVRRFWWGYYPAFGWVGAPFLVFFLALFVAALVEFRRDHRRARAEEDRQRSRWFLVAFGVGSFGTVDYLAAYGVPVYPFGYAAVLGFLAIAARTVRRFRLPDPIGMAGEEKFRSLSESASDAIVSANSRGDVLYVNHAAERVFGAEGGTLVGRPLSSLVAEGSRAAWDDAVRAVLAPDEGSAPPGALEVRGRRSRGEEFPMEVSLGRWTGPEGSFFTAILRDISDRTLAQEALRTSEEKFRSLLESSGAAVFIVDETRIRYANPAAGALAGVAPADLIERSFVELVQADWQDLVRQRIFAGASAGLAGLRYEVRLAGAADGRWVELTGRGIEYGGRPCMLLTAFDVTERRRAEDAMRESERRMRDILENVQLAAVFVDPEGIVTYANPYFLELVGLEEEDVIGKDWFDAFTSPEDRDTTRRAFRDRMLLGTVAAHEEGAILTRHKERRVIAWSNTVLRDFTGGVVGAASIGSDVTDSRRAEEQLQHDAFHDALTGLPNRALFMDRLQATLARMQGAAARGQKKGLFAVLFLDVDRFKLVNDSLGHSVGDRLLVELSGALKTAVRPGDTVARLGGDEFTILLEDLEAREEALAVAERIHAVLARPFVLAGHEAFTTVSVGIALSNPQYRRAEDVLRDADTAMYHAKAQGKSRHQVFDVSMHARARRLLQLENDLRRAIERREFIVHYQPIVRVGDGRLSGFEALVRWQHPERGLVGPAEFIHLAEETGLVVPLGRAVLEEACEAARGWAMPDLTVSVNLSARQFAQADLQEQVADVLQRSGLDPARLKLEVTESVVIDNSDAAIAALRRLKSLGLHIAIDDFGTGYSSLSYLLRLPADTLKIDRAFIIGIGQGGRNESIVRTVLTLAETLGMDVVAEGVETEEQRARLAQLGCPLAQGFLFSPAVDAGAARQLVAGQAGADLPPKDPAAG